MTETDAEDQAPEVAVSGLLINDGAIYDGDPNTDEPPGAHYDGRWWADSDDRDAHCDELVSPQHGLACSLHPDNCGDAQKGRQTRERSPSGYVLSVVAGSVVGVGQADRAGLGSR